jgi:hypothetical protein
VETLLCARLIHILQSPGLPWPPPPAEAQTTRPRKTTSLARRRTATTESRATAAYKPPPQIDGGLPCSAQQVTTPRAAPRKEAVLPGCSASTFMCSKVVRWWLRFFWREWWWLGDKTAPNAFSPFKKIIYKKYRYFISKKEVETLTSASKICIQSLF